MKVQCIFYEVETEDLHAIYMNVLFWRVAAQWLPIWHLV